MRGGRGRARWLAAGLALAILWLYAPVAGFDFLDYDDGLYVTDNPNVLQGWTGQTAAWAVTSLEIGNWHPLTWWSHALSVEAFGLEPGPHHRVNVWIHAATASALLLTLFSATGSLWRSVLVASVFGFHPLRVESVAWVAERKDVLCGLFFVLAVAAHVGWVRRRGGARYGLVLAAGLAALASKAMAVSLPAVLLLLDRWPLRREEPVWRLCAEKFPLLAMSALAAVAAIWAQDAGGALSSVAGWPWPSRIESSLVAYWAYLADSFWPAGLAVFYPHPHGGEPLPRVLLSGVLVAGLVGVGLEAFRRGSPVGVGLLWFLGTLLPVIGLITVGEQARADRYTYLPSIGLAIAVVWGLPARWASPRVIGPLAGAVVLGLVVATRHQLPHWQNDETLFARALAVTSDSYVAHLNYGNAIESPERREEQRVHFERAVALDPNSALAHYDLGRVIALSGEHRLAIDSYRRAVALDPELERAWNNLGNSLSHLGENELAERAYEQALVVAPSHASSVFNLGLQKLRRGELDEGRELVARYLTLRPGDHQARARLVRLLIASSRRGAALEVLKGAPELDLVGLEMLARLQWEEGEERAAVAAAERLLALQPQSAERRNDLAWMLATAADPTLRDGPRALELARGAVEAAGRQDPDLLDTLAAAQANAGAFDAAQATAAQALDRAREQGRLELVPALEQRALAYQGRRAFRRGGAASGGATP